MSSLSYTWYDSPVGPLLLAGSRTGLSHVRFSSGRQAVAVDPDWIENRSLFDHVMRQLREYFAGDRKTFSLSLMPEGTDFQRAVWTELQNIPYGEKVLRSPAKYSRSCRMT